MAPFSQELEPPQNPGRFTLPQVNFGRQNNLFSLFCSKNEQNPGFFESTRADSNMSRRTNFYNFISIKIPKHSAAARPTRANPRPSQSEPMTGRKIGPTGISAPSQSGWERAKSQIK